MKFVVGCGIMEYILKLQERKYHEHGNRMLHTKKDLKMTNLLYMRMVLLIGVVKKQRMMIISWMAR